ncbi:37S ribosomal protein S24 [Talaromyces marneffei ATCC 18224]|uniref:40S ribosomal protein S24 n=1 Tax=Talaromyces marneffei (strain ATCC 18224 / CBS 334.59 / QM 7333) TaxID=441960 RepID=B6QUY1_TALMQ|nr:37S ribosomal protein S24 [Talaromyces marneffei ATCC 18224]
MADAPITLRTRKFIRNPLLARKQMVVDVLHPNRANVSKDDLRGKLADLYKANKDQVSVFGFRTQFGGGKSTGFALVYDSHEALKKFEPHYRLVRIGAAAKIEKASRQQRTLFPLQDRRQDTDLSQANNARTVPRSSVVPPRPRVPRRARTKSFLRRGDDGDTKKGVDNCIEFTKSGNKLLFFLLTPTTNITFFIRVSDLFLLYFGASSKQTMHRSLFL